MEQPLISIIVPCYNVESYIPKSFASIINQTYKKWECIAVDDGSKDGTINEINHWVKQDPRFKMISQQNAGPSGARNTGLTHASGDCIYFFDSDDLLDEQCLQNLVDSFDASIDFVIGKNAKVHGQSTVVEDIMEHFNSGEKIPLDYDLLQLSLELSLSPVVWNKLYNRKFILSNNLTFKDGVIHEDELWFFEIMYLAKKVVFNSRVTYYYNVANEASITSNYSLTNLESFLTIIEYIFNKYYISEQSENRKKIFGSYLLHLQIDAVSAFFRFLKENKVGYKSVGVSLIKTHLAKHQIKEFSYLDNTKTKQYKLFIKYGATNPETAFKLIRNTNKKNILKFFENIYLKSTYLTTNV